MPVNASALDQGGQTGLAQMALTIRSASGNRHFTVEVAQSPEEQAEGLMFRRASPPTAP